VRRYFRLDEFNAVILQALEGFRFVLLHQAAVTDDISGENGGEDPLPTAAGSSKLMGDGPLGEFTSVVDAVERAVDIQRGMAERNSSEPEDQGIDFDVGQPSIDPELMIRIVIVGYCFGIPRALRFVRTDSRSPPA
jgi:class 3 adenylate cyclase